jgi:hypothetical protein
VSESTPRFDDTITAVSCNFTVIITGERRFAQTRKDCAYCMAFSDHNKREIGHIMLSPINDMHKDGVENVFWGLNCSNLKSSLYATDSPRSI